MLCFLLTLQALTLRVLASNLHFGTASAFGLAGGGGDRGLLSEPLKGFNDGQVNADFTLSVREGRRPLSVGGDS